MTEQLEKVIDGSLGNPNLSPKQIINTMGMSRTKLYRDLKRIGGQSPSDYVHNIRLEKVASLLTDTELNMQEIMNEMGSANSSYSTKIFKLKHDMPPTEYKKSYQVFSFYKIEILCRLPYLVAISPRSFLMFFFAFRPTLQKKCN